MRAELDKTRVEARAGSTLLMQRVKTRKNQRRGGKELTLQAVNRVCLVRSQQKLLSLSTGLVLVRTKVFAYSRRPSLVLGLGGMHASNDVAGAGEQRWETT